MDSMRKYLSADSLATRVKLLRSSFPNVAILLVEGDPDSEVYGNLLRCRILGVAGKDQIIAAMQVLERRKVSGVIAIVDADFDILSGRTIVANALFLTDTHDLETMLVQSAALDKVMARYLRGEAKNDRRKVASNIRKKVLRLAKTVGYLRWYVLNEKLPLGFKHIDLGLYLDTDKESIDLMALIEEARDKNQKCAITESQMIENSAKLYDDTHSPWHVCHGKDVLQLIVALLPILKEELARAGSVLKIEEGLTFKVIRNYLCAAYEIEHFRGTTLYASLQEWQNSNPNYQPLLN